MTKETFTLEEVKVILRSREPTDTGCYCDGECGCYHQYRGAESLFHDICYDFGIKHEDLEAK